MATDGIETAQRSANEESEQSAGTAPVLVPARMLNEYAYCPRLAYLEWVQGEFADSVDTVEGRFQHRRVDRPSGKLPARSGSDEADTEEGEGRDSPETIHARSVLLSDDALGAIARIDLTSRVRATWLLPSDYKHGTAPDVPDGAWEPERVQVCIQGLLLRANGYTCTQGMLYFVESRQRVAVPFDDVLVSRTLGLLSGIRSMAASGRIPEPLVDSPKCPRCSLAGICLPDEVNFLSPDGPSIKPEDVRRMYPARDDAVPVYVHTQGAVVGKSGGQLEVKQKGQVPAEGPPDGNLPPGPVRQRPGHRPGGSGAVRPGHPHLLLQLRGLVPGHHQRHGPQERRTALPAVPGSDDAGDGTVHLPPDGVRQAKELPHPCCAAITGSCRRPSCRNSIAWPTARSRPRPWRLCWASREPPPAPISRSFAV